MTLWGWRYPDGEIDHNSVAEIEEAVWNTRWKLSGQHEFLDSDLSYRDFDHWVQVMKEEGNSVVPVRVTEIKPEDT